MNDENNTEEKNSKNTSKEEIIIPEEQISEDKYKIMQNQESNIMTDKLIQLMQEKLLSPIERFNIDLIKKYDSEGMFSQEILEQLEEDIENYKKTYIEQQFKIIKEIISKFNLKENLDDISEEKTFAEELKSYDISIDIFSFIGPLNEKIKEIREKNKSEELENSNEIEKALFKLLEINYYNNKTSSLEESIKILDSQIEDLKNKNKII